jgi:hypothetical protein
LIGALKDRKTREAAAKALAAIGAPAAKPLVNSLGSLDDGVRKSATEALIAIGGPAAKPVIEALKSFDTDKHNAAVRVLRSIGMPAVEPLIRALESGNLQNREATGVSLILRELTGQEFGWNAAKWRQWHDGGFEVEKPKPVARPAVSATPTPPLVCPKCGEKNLSSRRHCAICGASLTRSVSEEALRAQMWAFKEKKELSLEASRHVSAALEIVEAQVRIERGFVQVESTGAGEKLMEAAHKLEEAHKLHPRNPLLHYAWASALHLAWQHKSAEDEMRGLAQSNPDFLLAGFAIEGWERWAPPFKLPPWSSNTTSVHPAISASVVTGVLLAVRDGLEPRATLFLRDTGGDFRDVRALRSARLDITTVISPVTNPQIVGIYASIWDDPSRPPFQVEALGAPLFPRGHSSRSKYESLCVHRDIDFVVIDNHDRILLNKRLPMSGNMRQANQRLLKLLKASAGREISEPELMDAIMSHQRAFSHSHVRY